MARRLRYPSLESRTARLKLSIRRKPYPGPALSRGVLLLYRRNKGNGSWVLKASDGHGKYWTKAIGEADDFDESNGETILTFYQVQDIAKQLARGGKEVETTALITVDRALVDYKRDLISRVARPYNADRPRVHLTALLLSKPVALLTSRELKAWRDGLLGTIAPASINRVCNSLCAALELAAQHDQRIKNRDSWEVGLAALPEAQQARSVVLIDAQVHAFVAAAYRHDPALGLLVDTLAVTGTRPSQAVRLRVEDLHDHPDRPKLMMPKSAKGGGRNRVQKKNERYSVPITPVLSKRLKAAAAGRADDAALLLRSNGKPWSEAACQHYRTDVRKLFKAIGESDKVTMYALRHSSIVRALLLNVPIRLVASLHNTSVAMIERTYSRFITEHSDEISRRALLQYEPQSGNNVIPLTR